MRRAASNGVDALIPVHLDEFREHVGLSLDTTSENARLWRCLDAARAAIEREYGVALIYQTVTVEYLGPALRFDLPVRPVRSVTSVTLTDSDGEEESLTVADLTTWGEQVGYASGAVLVPHASRATVVYEAGYGSIPQRVPEPWGQAVSILAADLYHHRSSIVVGAGIARLDLVRDLLWNERRLAV